MFAIAIDSVKVLTSPKGSRSYNIFAILISNPGYFSSFCLRAVLIKPLNNGCGFCGLDLNSGWN